MNLRNEFSGKKIHKTGISVKTRKVTCLSTMAFPPLKNSDHVVVSVSVDFLPYSKGYALFHHIAYDYSHDDWDGLCNHLRGVPWEDIFKLGAFAQMNFVSGSRLELIYISLIVNIRSNFMHLHEFQLFVLLP